MGKKDVTKSMNNAFFIIIKSHLKEVNRMCNNRYLKSVLVSLLMMPSIHAVSADRGLLLKQYIQQGASSFSAESGQKLWFSVNKGEAPFSERSCTTCHTQDLKNTGEHVRTNKRIDAMSQSVNPTRLSDTQKVEKWFKRNCKWTFGRECSAQEKGDIITYIQSH